MKKIFALFAFIGVLCSISAQKVNETVTMFGKDQLTGFTVNIDNASPEIVAAAMANKFEKEFFMKGSFKKGFHVYESQPCAAFGEARYDTYFATAPVGKKKDQYTQVFLVVSTGNMNCITFSNDPRTSRNIVSFLEGLKYDVEKYKTELRMVKNGDAVWKFIEELRAPALPKAREEVAELNSFAKSIGFTGDQIRPWDFSYYAEKQRVAKYNVTDEELKPYFRLEDCINAIFSLAGRLYGITFKPADVPVYHPDVKVYEVRDADGSFLALFYADFFPRATKRSGAWMTSFRDLKIQDGVEERPFISLVTNFTKPTADTPSLITHDEFTTMLHEFGHSLHGIMAKGRYPSMTGTSVDHDFVELPSQIMENWAYEKEYLNTFAKHYKTGQPLPDELIAKIKASKNYLSAYYHMRQLQFGILDMNYHTLTAPIEGEVIKFEKDALKSTDVLPTVPECIISTSFSHIFSGGYAAGYYSYKWAEVLAADGYSLFEEKGIFDKETAGKFRHLLEQGGSVDAAQLYREFRGHDPEPAALLRQLEIIK